MNPISASTAVAAAAARLEAAGFTEVLEEEDAAGTSVRVFEDAVSIVATCGYSSWGALEERWTAAQGLLVELMTSYLGRGEPKSWEGYLFLMTPDDAADDQLGLDQIRRDTSRVRKLVATKSELGSLAAVGDALLPVLPLELDALAGDVEDILDRLPRLLQDEGVAIETGTAVVDAFKSNRSPMDALAAARRSS